MNTAAIQPPPRQAPLTAASTTSAESGLSAKINPHKSNLNLQPHAQHPHHNPPEQQQQHHHHPQYQQHQKSLSSVSSSSATASSSSSSNNNSNSSNSSSNGHGASLHQNHFSSSLKNRSSVFFNTSTSSFSNYTKFASSSRDFLYHSNSASRLAFATSYDGFFSDDVYVGGGGSDEALITGSGGGGIGGIMEFEDSRFYEGRYEDREHEYEEGSFYRQHQQLHSSQQQLQQIQQQQQQQQQQQHSNKQQEPTSSHRSQRHLPGSQSKENLRQWQFRLSEEPAPSEPTIFAGRQPSLSTKERLPSIDSLSTLFRENEDGTLYTREDNSSHYQQEQWKSQMLKTPSSLSLSSSSSRSSLLQRGGHESQSFRQESGSLQESKGQQKHQHQQHQHQHHPHQQAQEGKGVKESGGTEHLCKIKRKSLQLELQDESENAMDLEDDHEQSGSPVSQNQDLGQDVIPDQEKPKPKRRKRASLEDSSATVKKPTMRKQKESGPGDLHSQDHLQKHPSQPKQYFGSEMASTQFAHPTTLHLPPVHPQSHHYPQQQQNSYLQTPIEQIPAPLQTHANQDQRPYQSQYHAQSRHRAHNHVSSSSSLSISTSSSFTSTHSSNFITEEQFLLLAEDYLLSLSPKKREKALLSNSMYQKILMVLIQPKNTQVSTAQFRFWAKKMFTLSTTPTHHVVCHGGKPVATKECLYDVLVYCHRKSSHGGRDKTSAEVRQHYSWVPKELIARFVKHCPLCLSRRATQPRSSSGTNALSASSTASYYSGYRRGSGEEEGDDFEKIERQHSHAVEDEEEGGYDVQSLPLHYSGDTVHYQQQQQQQQQPGLAHPQQVQGQFSLSQSVTRPGYEPPLAHSRDHHLHQQQYHPNHNYMSNQMQSPVRSTSGELEDGTQEEAVDFTQNGLEGDEGQGRVEAQDDLTGAFTGDGRSSQGFRPLLYHQKSHSLSYSQHPQHHHQLHQHLHHEPASPSAPIAVVHPNGHILHDRHPILNSARLFALDQGVGARGAGGVATLSAFPMTPSPSFHHRTLSLSPLHLNTAAFRTRLMPHLHSGLTATSNLDSPVELESDQSGDDEDEPSEEGRPEDERQSQSSGEDEAESGGEDEDMDADEN